jgi:hypothetical protein
MLYLLKEEKNISSKKNNLKKTFFLIFDFKMVVKASLNSILMNLINYIA